jgi:hypothetical protein
MVCWEINLLFFSPLILHVFQHLSFFFYFILSYFIYFIFICLFIFLNYGRFGMHGSMTESHTNYNYLPSLTYSKSLCSHSSLSPLCIHIILSVHYELWSITANSVDTEPCAISLNPQQYAEVGVKLKRDCQYPNLIDSSMTMKKLAVCYRQSHAISVNPYFCLLPQFSYVFHSLVDLFSICCWCFWHNQIRLCNIICINALVKK